MSSGRDLHRSHSYDPNLLLHRPSAVPGLEKGIKHYMSDLVHYFIVYVPVEQLSHLAL